ncbi:MAG TPA: biotin/lipoyl-containing protein [Blastocatellia bacterium]|nr:biotin/lipoyl-containing protein [Blastocatellia bacterium]
MKLELNIDGKVMEVEFQAADGELQMALADSRYTARVSEPEPGLFTVIINDRVYRCALERTQAGETEIIVNGRRIPVAVRDRKRLRSGAGSAGAGGGRATLTAPMPGKVVRVLKAAGDEVESGQGVLVVEAMKMQNEVQSPKAGKVIELRVTEGQTVNAGETLAVIE